MRSPPVPLSSDDVPAPAPSTADDPGQQPQRSARLRIHLPTKGPAAPSSPAPPVNTPSDPNPAPSTSLFQSITQEAVEREVRRPRPGAVGRAAGPGRAAALERLMAIAGSEWTGAGRAARLAGQQQQKFSCPASEGQFPGPGTECRVYYQCAQGSPVRRECGPGLRYSTEIETCDWDKNVDCTS